MSEKRELIRPNWYVLKDGVAVISNHSINEEKMRMVMSQIMSAEIFILKFCSYEIYSGLIRYLFEFVYRK